VTIHHNRPCRAELCRVRETLDFAARVQGVGHKDEELRVLLEREKAAGLEPDPEVDAFVKVRTALGPSSPQRTLYSVFVPH